MGDNPVKTDNKIRNNLTNECIRKKLEVASIEYKMRKNEFEMVWVCAMSTQEEC